MRYSTFEEIKEGCKKLAEYIKKKANGEITLVGIARGGLIPAVIVAHILNIKDIKIVKISSYSDEKKEKVEFEDNTTDKIEDSENNFFIDDVLDTGATMEYLKNKFPKSNFLSVFSKREVDFVHPAILADREEWIMFPWDNE